MKKKSPPRLISTPHGFAYPLSNKTFHEKKILPLKISFETLLKKHITCFDKEKITLDIKKHLTIEEKIYAIFTHESVITGNKALLNKDLFIKQISSFTQNNNPIRASLLSFPFKIPCPLKTDRVLPDLGELTTIYQLALLGELIQNEYKPGIQFITLGESLIFRDIMDISLGEAIAYREVLKSWIKELKVEKFVKFVDLRDSERQIPKFYDVLTNLEVMLKKNYGKDSETTEMIESTKPALRLVINTRGIDKKRLMDIYNTAIPTNKLSPADKEVREEIEQSVENIVYRYTAYQLTIKQTQLREILWPGSIGVSSVAKPDRFGIFPLNNVNTLFPIHGVPVYRKNKFVTIHYIIDVLRDKTIPFAYIAPGRTSSDPEPFFYSEVAL